MSHTRTNDLGRDPIGPLLFRLALPAILAQVVNALYNIVDRVYIGHMEPDGALALTGLGVCFSILMFVSALAYRLIPLVQSRPSSDAAATT